MPEIYTELILGGVIIALIVFSLLDRRNAEARERDLLNRLMSRDVTEYAQATRAVNTSSEEEIRKMQVENELAENYAKGAGIPVGT